jgi:hypothetical protein
MIIIITIRSAHIGFEESLEYSTVAEDQGSNVDFYSFKIKIKRRALYYGVMVIAPTVLFALLNPLVFLLPVESGERLTDERHMKYLGIAHAMNANIHCCSSKGYFEISVGHLASFELD